jgi:hypothetical protein
MLRQDELAFLKAISSFQMSPAMLKWLRLAMARRKKRPAVPAGKRSTPSGSGTSAFQPRGQAEGQRASKLGRLHGARQQAPSTWRWVLHSASDLSSHGRTSCPRQPETRTIRGGGYVCDCIVRVRRSISAKWDAQAHSQGFGLVRIRCLDGDIRKAHVSGHVRVSERHARWHHYPRPCVHRLPPSRTAS